MARVYSSRIMLDPSVLQNMNNVAQQRYQNEDARRQSVLSPMRDLINSAGKSFDDYVAESQRANEVSKWDLVTDPIANAAREEYIRTGSSQPLMSYQMQKLAAEAKKRADEKAESEKKYQKELHDAVTLREDRNKYSQLQANMFKAMDEGNMADAQTYKNQMEGLEQHYAKYYPDYKNPFGDTAQSMWNARSEQKRLADEKRAQEEADKQELELGEKNLKAIQDINEQERLYKVEQFLSTLPTVFKNDAAKQKVYDLINNNEDMNTAEKAAMLKKVRETDSGETAKKKAKQGVAANKAGEATGEAIDEAKNKTAAMEYNGKKLNSLEWNKIPDEQKKFLIRDAAGNVSMKE